MGVEGGWPGQLWQFLDVDLFKVAESMGAFGVRAERLGVFWSGVDQALDLGGRGQRQMGISDIFSSLSQLETINSCSEVPSYLNK